MEKNRESFIAWLKEIGAENIKDFGDDEAISFEHAEKKIEIFGIWFNDRTAGVGINVGTYNIQISGGRYPVRLDRRVMRFCLTLAKRFATMCALQLKRGESW